MDLKLGKYAERKTEKSVFCTNLKNLQYDPKHTQVDHRVVGGINVRRVSPRKQGLVPIEPSIPDLKLETSKFLSSALPVPVLVKAAEYLR